MATALASEGEAKASVISKSLSKGMRTKPYMWVTTGGAHDRRVALYHYSRTRNAAFISEFLAEYRGFLQTDGYEGYTAIGEKEGIVHVECWAHARRKFVGPDAHPDSNALRHRTGGAREILRLQRLEGRVRLPDRPARGRDAYPFAYTRGMWPQLIRYLDCSYLTPDNNEAERAIRPFTVGRKNWVISGGPRGAFSSATLYSIIETAKLCELEPYYYLRHVLTKLPTIPSERLPELLPWNVDVAAFGDLTAEDARLSLDSIAID